MTNYPLTVERILEYIDVPQLFLGRDCFDTQYLCLLYDDDPVCRYTGIRISTNRLSAYYQGKVDLRNLFITPEFKNEYFDGSFLNGEYIIDSNPLESLSEDRLPSDGFFHDNSDNEIVSVSIPKKERRTFFQLMRRHGWVAM